MNNITEYESIEYYEFKISVIAINESIEYQLQDAIGKNFTSENGYGCKGAAMLAGLLHAGEIMGTVKEVSLSNTDLGYMQH